LRICFLKNHNFQMAKKPPPQQFSKQATDLIKRSIKTPCSSWISTHLKIDPRTYSQALYQEPAIGISPSKMTELLAALLKLHADNLIENPLVLYVDRDIEIVDKKPSEQGLDGSNSAMRQGADSQITPKDVKPQNIPVLLSNPFDVGRRPPILEGIEPATGGTANAQALNHIDKPKNPTTDWTTPKCETLQPPIQQPTIATVVSPSVSKPHLSERSATSSPTAEEERTSATSTFATSVSQDKSSMRSGQRSSKGTPEAFIPIAKKGWTGLKLGIMSSTLLAAAGLLVQTLWLPISRTDSGQRLERQHILAYPESSVVNAPPPNESTKQASCFVKLVRQADIFDFENHHLRFLPAKTLFTRALDPQLNHAKNSSILSQHSSVLTAIRVSVDAGDSLSYYIDALPNGAPNEVPQYATVTLNGNGKLYLVIISSPPCDEQSYSSFLLLTETGLSTRKFEIPEPLVGKTSTVSFSLLLCQPSGPLSETMGLTLEYRDKMKP
jgi:hypothetical protein